MAAFPPDKSFSGPLAKQSLSQPSGKDAVDSPPVDKPLAKGEFGKNKIDSKDQFGKGKTTK